MIAVIGAGPAGSTAALRLAKAGERVMLIEDHPCVGEPVACTGLLTRTILDLMSRQDLGQSVVNECRAVDVIAPGGATARIPAHEFIVDRARFDRLLARQAQDHGALLMANHRFVGKKGDDILLSHKGMIVRKPADILIGADGPVSEVAKSAGLMRQRKNYIGMQATVKGAFDKDVFSTWFGDICPGFFAWSVPESATIGRVGLATTAHTRERFEALLRKVMPANATILAKQAGPIPLYSPRAAASDPRQNVFLVGDAAGLVKATTGGGIISGMLSANHAADAILKDANYETLLLPLRRELFIHLAIRRALNRFSATDYDALVGMMRDKRVQQVLSDNTREYPSRFLFKLLRAQPALLRFAPKGALSLFM